MKKYIISFCLLCCLSLFVNAQTNDAVAWEKVDSTKKELKTAKGKKLVDCYNLLAQCYFWIWDDNDKHFDTAYMYQDKAYNEAKKINYKRGIAYSKANLTSYPLIKMDKDTSNNDREVPFIQTYQKAKEALQLAAELKDDYLSGLIYYHLAWREKWWGSREKFKAHTQKAIYHIAKVSGNEFKEDKPLLWVNCSGCKGTEALLAHLNRDLSTIYFWENNPLAAEKLELALRYYMMARTINRPGFLNPVGSMYQTLGQFYFLKYDYKNALEFYKKASESYHEDGSIEQELRARNEISKVYDVISDFENGIMNFKNSLKLIEDYFKDKPAGSAKSNSAGQSFFWMSRLYKTAGDYEAALTVMRRSGQYYPGGSDSEAKAPWMSEMGDAHRLLGNYDSAMHYLKGFQSSDNTPNNFGKISLGYLYLDLKEYAKAQSLMLPFYQGLKKINRINNPIIIALNIMGNASMGEKKYEQALRFAKEAQTYLKQAGIRILMIDNYKLLSEIYDKMNKSDSAYAYLKLHTKLKDSLISRQFYFKLNSLKNESDEQKKTSLILLLQKDNQLKQQLLIRESLLQQQKDGKLALLNKDNELKDQQIVLREQDLKEQRLLRDKNRAQLYLLDNENKLKDQKLSQQSFIRNALLGGLLLFLLLAVFVYRNQSLKRKNEKLAIEKKQSMLQQKVGELEIKALRAQMNPHFIFNCLSSINKFILKNDTDAASDYLTRFSRLIRLGLTNSQLSLIPLSDEIEMLRLYLNMERLRFSETFTYNIIYQDTIEPETIYIPPMLLQPFCENAIWHGLMHKQGQGKLDVIMSIDKGELQCTIADDGIGRDKAAELKTRSGAKQKSYGLKITTERLALFNSEKAVNSFYRSEDLLDKDGQIAGTKVTLKIKYKTTASQPVKEFV